VQTELCELFHCNDSRKTLRALRKIFCGLCGKIYGFIIKKIPFQIEMGYKTASAMSYYKQKQFLTNI